MPYGAECNCSTCTEARTIYGARDNQERYVDARESGANMDEACAYVSAQSGRIFANTYLDWRDATTEDYPDPDDDDEPYDSRENERYMAEGVSFAPLDRILTRGGRYWSAEVEVNDISAYQAASRLGIERGDYSEKPTRDCQIIAASDCTCGAEIKIGRVRDGARAHASSARAIYSGLRNAGATCGENTGHHVHVDATRICDLGGDAVERVLAASLTLASALEPTIKNLCASGYSQHREHSSDYSGSLKDSNVLRQRGGWHASNAYYYANDSGGIPTFEFRIPNGTTYATRAHAYVAVALGLLDFGERCHDRDPEALTFERQARERIAHSQDWSQADGAAILTRALHLHPDSLKAIHLTAETAPLNEQTVNTFAIAAA